MTNARTASSSAHATAKPPTIATRTRTASIARAYPRAMRFALGAAMLAAIALVASACGSSHTRTVRSSGLMLHGTVRCTVTLTKPAEAGHELGAVFSFHNVSKRTVKVDLVYGGMWLLVRSPDGTTYDTRVPLENVQG